MSVYDDRKIRIRLNKQMQFLHIYAFAFANVKQEKVALFLVNVYTLSLFALQVFFGIA